MSTDKPIANPLVVLREEFDDWAILFDPDTGHAFGLNPIGVFVWQRLDGKHTIQDILSELQDSCQEVPGEADSHVQEFIDHLLKNGLAGYEYQI
jgi:SynChlorMet cassette protein ScmD